MARKRNYYFDNKAVEAAIKSYQEKGDIKIMHPYTGMITSLIIGVINTHKIYRFHNDQNELVQEAFVALYSALNRFNPEKGTAFNYLSIVVKQYLKNWTRAQNNKAWKTLEFQDSFYNSEDMHDNALSLDEVFSTHALPEEYDGLLEDITNGVVHYRISNYQDMIKHLQGNGWSSKEIKGAFKLLKKDYGKRK